eukprot:6212495-Pleurochrysis_carterae.AAC.3
MPTERNGGPSSARKLQSCRAQHKLYPICCILLNTPVHTQHQTPDHHSRCDTSCSLQHIPFDVTIRALSICLPQPVVSNVRPIVYLSFLIFAPNLCARLGPLPRRVVQASAWSEPSERASALGQLSSATTAAFLVGQGLGGLLASRVDPRAPPAVAVALYAADAVWVRRRRRQRGAEGGEGEGGAERDTTGDREGARWGGRDTRWRAERQRLAQKGRHWERERGREKATRGRRAYERE